MKTSWLIILVLALSTAGCGRDAGERARTAEEEAEAAAARAEEATRVAEEATAGLEKEVEGIVGEALSAARGALNDGRNVEPVDGGTLQALLPEVLDNHARTNVNANRDGAMGFYVTTATAEYRGDGAIEVAIIDLGGVASPSMMGYAWTEDEVDRETAGGYERTVQFEGYKAHQKYDEHTEQGEMAVLVADRFIVAVEGDGVSMNEIKDALSRIDLDRLEAMHDAGVQASE